MLNVGPLELLVVLAVALIVVGPERLPELARSVGRAMRQLRQVQDEVRDMVQLGVDDEMRDAASEFKRASGSVKRASDVKGAVRRAGRSLQEDATVARAATDAATHRTDEATPTDAERESTTGAPSSAPDVDRPTTSSEPAPTPAEVATDAGSDDQPVVTADDDGTTEATPLRRRTAPQRPTGTEPPDRA